MKIGANYGSFVLVPEGKQDLKVVEVKSVPKSKPKSIEVTFAHKNGGKITQKYDLGNDAAMYHLTMLYVNCTNTKPEEFDVDDLVGKFAKMLVVHNVGTKENEDGEFPTFANIKKSVGLAKPWATEAIKDVPVEEDDDLDDLDDDEDLDDLDDDDLDEDDLP